MAAKLVMFHKRYELFRDWESDRERTREGERWTMGLFFTGLFVEKNVIIKKVVMHL